MMDQLPEPAIHVTPIAEDVKMHTFISPDAFLANATHIIESRNDLVIIDGQFIVPYALQFRAYADSLEKSIRRVYLSHEHPDHFFGLGAAFSDCPIYALPQTIGFLNENGEAIRSEMAGEYGDFVAKTLALPTFPVVESTETIDGVVYKFTVYKHAETDYQLAITLPDSKVMITQDLLYSGAHLYISHDLDNWIETLQTLRESENVLFFAGHGKPCDRSEIDNNIRYLKKARELLAGNVTPDAFRAELLAAFPERTGPAIFDIYLPRLFGSEVH